MGSPLLGCHEKQVRAQEHFETLRNEVLAFATPKQGESYECDSEIDPQTGEEVIRLRISEPVPLLRWGAILGDVFHNLRSILDHLIEQATIHHTGRALPRTEFPIFDIERGTSGIVGYRDAQRKQPKKPDPRSGLFKVRGISPELQTLVERLQPYQRGSAAHLHPLWRLHRFDILDKHKIIPVVGIAGSLNFFGVGGPGAAQLIQSKSIRIRSLIPYEDGAEMARFRVTEGTVAPVDVKMGLTMQIRFDQGEPGFADETLPVVADIWYAVSGVMRMFSEALGVDPDHALDP